MKLTTRGEITVATVATILFVAALGIAGWFETGMG